MLLSDVEYSYDCSLICIVIVYCLFFHIFVLYYSIGNETALELIGGADKYLSTCRRCFFKSNVIAQPSPMKLKRKAKAFNDRAKILNKKLRLEESAEPVKIPAILSETHTPTNDTIHA